MGRNFCLHLLWVLFFHFWCVVAFSIHRLHCFVHVSHVKARTITFSTEYDKTYEHRFQFLKIAEDWAYNICETWGTSGLLLFLWVSGLIPPTHYLCERLCSVTIVLRMRANIIRNAVWCTTVSSSSCPKPGSVYFVFGFIQCVLCIPTSASLFTLQYS